MDKTIDDICPQFRPAVSAIGPPSYKLTKILVPKLSSIIFNENTVKDSFAFGEEIVHQTVNLLWVTSTLTLYLLIYLLKRP